MARGDAKSRQNIDLVATRWRERCLVEDGSLLFDDQVWTAANIGSVYHNVVETPLLEKDRSFTDKLKEQLSGEPALVRLGAEAMVVYYLFAWHGAVGARRKRQLINEILGWADESLPEDGEVWRALGENGIGHPGQYFLYRPDTQLGFLMDLARRLKEKDETERREIVSGPWKFQEFADAGLNDGATGMRHILLHLLYPESFERISSGEHKHAIISTYSGLLADQDLSGDRALLAIRERLQDLLGLPPEKVDFYEPPLYGTWGTGSADGSDLVGALELKKQVVLFGPPGTSKTFEAKELAEQIIRRQALKRWGPVAYFEKQARIRDVIDTHVERRQLHPAYSYEEFIRGQRLKDGGQVEYEDGDLLRLIKNIEDEEVPEGELKLPWVLILDELNRADLSRVFGEAFSVLEDREADVTLSGGAAGSPARKIRMPADLYVIGTMNLIDQSLEQIDFALRRRFLWHPSRFDPDRLRRVLEELWQETAPAKRFPWSRIQADMATFVDRATALNTEIRSSKLLGRDYEIGHTYFFDIVNLLAGSERMDMTNPSQFLWNTRRQALTPGAVRDLWRMSLEPLLAQYLQGIDWDQRSAELDRLAQVFLTETVTQA